EPKKPFDTTNGTPIVPAPDTINVALLTLRVPVPAAPGLRSRTGPLLTVKPLAKVLFPLSDNVPLPRFCNVPLPEMALFNVTDPKARFLTSPPQLSVRGPLPRLPAF